MEKHLRDIVRELTRIRKALEKSNATNKKVKLDVEELKNIVYEPVYEESRGL